MDGGAVWPSHSTAAQLESIHATSRTDSIKFVSHRLLSDSIMHNPDLGGHHWHSSWGFSYIFWMISHWYPNAFCKVSAFFEQIPWKIGWSTGWLVNPRSKPIPGHLAERSTDPSWIVAECISMWFPSRFPLLRASMSWFATFCKFARKVGMQKVLSILTSKVKRHEMLGFIV